MAECSFRFRRAYLRGSIPKVHKTEISGYLLGEMRLQREVYAASTAKSQPAIRL